MALPPDDLTPEHARRVRDARDEEHARALELVDRLAATTAPDRNVDILRDHARQIAKERKAADDQIVVRSRTTLRRRAVRAGRYALGWAWLPPIPLATAANLPEGGLIAVGVPTGLLAAFAMIWSMDTKGPRRIAPLDATPIPVPVLPALADVPDVPRVLIDPDRPAPEAAADRHARVTAEYVAYECSPVAVFTRPALADIRVPDTAAFHDALAAADAARDGSDRSAYERAVAALERAWQVAQATADLAGRRSPAELRDGDDPAPNRDRRLRRALALARTYEDPGAEDAERQAALAAALREADGIVPVPARVKEILALPAGAGA